MKTKYIRNQYRFVVFPETSQHRETAIKGLGPNKLIHGAGFVRLNFDGEKIQAECYGHSESLNIKPRYDDHVHILKSIGVENGSEVQYAKYVILGGKAVVFSPELDYNKVAEGAFYGSTNFQSAGMVKLLVEPSGKIKIECVDDSVNIGVSAKQNDYKKIARLMEIPESMLLNYL